MRLVLEPTWSDYYFFPHQLVVTLTWGLLYLVYDLILEFVVDFVACAELYRQY